LLTNIANIHDGKMRSSRIKTQDFAGYFAIFGNQMFRQPLLPPEPGRSIVKSMYWVGNFKQQRAGSRRLRHAAPALPHQAQGRCAWRSALRAPRRAPYNPSMACARIASIIHTIQEMGG
jgi:hypothetical protein